MREHPPDLVRLVAARRQLRQLVFIEEADFAGLDAGPGVPPVSSQMKNIL